MEELYTVSEIMIATGLKRGAVSNRAKHLGFERTGRGYTYAQVLKIATHGTHRTDKDKALLLRDMLNRTFETEGWPLKIQTKRGISRIEEYDASLYMSKGENDI